MLKPNLSRELVPSPATTAPLVIDKLAWNPLSPVEDLPQALSQLREAQQHVNRLVHDAEAQVVQFLRRGPFASHTADIKILIERFYPFTIKHLEAFYTDLTAHFVNENVLLAIQNNTYAFWKGFAIDWDYISASRALTLATLEKKSAFIVWSQAAANPLIDWNISSIKRHYRLLNGLFPVLSSNPGIHWTPELLRAFAPHWDYSSEGLLGNDALPWEDESLADLLLEIAPQEAELDEDVLKETTEEMQYRLWERLSLNRHRLWTLEELRQHREVLDWSRLSANPGLPFSLALFTEFESYWNWDELTANLGFYNRVLQPLLSDTVVREFLVLSQL